MKDSDSGKSTATDPSTGDGPANSTAGGAQPSKGISALVLDLVRPYRKWLVVVFVAMLVETAMSIAAPWPLKIIIDNVVGKHKLPEFLTWLRDFSSGEHTLALAGVAALGVVIVSRPSARSRATSTTTTPRASRSMWPTTFASALYHHLQRLSLKYYDTHQIGNMLSTITTDVSTIQSFASTALLSILVDALTIVGMLGVMLYLNFDFALIAVGVTPVLLFFVSRFKKAVKKATHEVRKRQSDIVGVVRARLGIGALGQGLRPPGYGGSAPQARRASETVEAALKARRVKSLLSPIVSVTVACAWPLCSGAARD